MEPNKTPPEQEEIRRLANAIRGLSMDAVQTAKSGHPGLPLGMADAATVLFSRFLKFDPADPHWPDRDRFVLSGGHGSMLLYSLLYLLGYAGPTLDQIKRFRQVDSPCAGHPEHGHLPGIETTTGPLGQGISNAVGMAVAERLLNARFGDDLVNHKTYVIASDGDLQEGISHEAISLAGHYRLKNLIVLWDDNNISIDGDTRLADSSNVIERFEAAGWKTTLCDGHSAQEVFRALTEAQSSDKPFLIACKTVIGFGFPTRAGTQKAHSDAPGQEEIDGAKKALGLPPAAFALDDGVLDAWRKIGQRNADARAAWTKRADASARKTEFAEAMAGTIPSELGRQLGELKQELAAEKPNAGTRRTSEKVLEVINGVLKTTIGGSADLTPSNNTKTKNITEIRPDDFSGRYIHYGIREHGMAAAMNGMALHGGIIPYGGTFLVFSDYCRPAIRLAAIMGIRVVFVMTHDSIGVGEDGPTHQPVEHVAALRAIPGLQVIRPADAVETVEAWELAINHKGPTLLAFSRQDVPTVRADAGDNRSAKGAYEIAGTDNAAVTLLATGSEVGLAMEARDLLKADGVAARVVSMPCWSLFEQQSEIYREQVLGTGTKVAVEAGVREGWDRYIGPHGRFVGMHGFGASGPYKDVYKHFGLTPHAVADAAKAALKK
ncbi:MAG: transketolase [Alphaproteobacteria bacterium]|nr:transketolase [Alphaproteobacteria bacterium]MBL7097416.1 transketolase [Alphaproteobacteria bacterium]